MKNTSGDTLVDETENEHLSTNPETPLRPDAFLLSDELKIKKIASRFRDIMHTLGLDLNDESLKGTPERVAKMYVMEMFSGLKPENKPDATLFTKNYPYNEMLIEKDIAVHSNCEHHFVPITGKAHVAYIPAGKVIGLSKINRIVQYFSRRPQVQERLTSQIAEHLKEVLCTADVAVVIDAAHHCVSSRGIGDHGSSTVTASYSGKFKDEKTRNELLLNLYKSKGCNP